MTALPIDRLLPEIVPATDVKEIVWKGSLAHIGPLVKSTPLHGELCDITCCGLYLLYIGCIGLISKRMAPVMNTNLNRCLSEQIFAYQFDWRYPSPYGITLTDIDENPDKIAAIRRLVPYFFFDFIKRTNGYFLSSPPIQDVGFVVNLTRHLCGKPNKATVEAWLKKMIARLEGIAPSEYLYPVLQEFPTRAAWEAAVRQNHGEPLPIDVLDVTATLDGTSFKRRAAEQLAAIDPSNNPLLKSTDELKGLGFVGVPYRAEA